MWRLAWKTGPINSNEESARNSNEFWSSCWRHLRRGRGESLVKAWVDSIHLPCLKLARAIATLDFLLFFKKGGSRIKRYRPAEANKGQLDLLRLDIANTVWCLTTWNGTNNKDSFDGRLVQRKMTFQTENLLNYSLFNLLEDFTDDLAGSDLFPSTLEIIS